MNNASNIWGTKVGQDSISATVELFIAFTAVAGVQGLVAEEAVEKQLAGEQFSDEEWASI